MNEVNTPLFHGQLVRLAAPNAETDAEPWAGWSRDSEFARLMDSESAVPMSPKQAKEEMEKAGPNPNFFPFVIRTLADDRLVGFVGLFGLQWTHGDAWVGIGIGDRADWGKGYGTEAMRLLLRFAFTELNLHRVSLGLLDYNLRALRSYQKVGFVLEGRSREDVHRDGRYWDSLWMGILREDWEKTQS